MSESARGVLPSTFYTTFVEEYLKQVHTAIPAQVISFDAAKRTISCQPTLKVTTKDNILHNLPVCSDVPVIFPGGGEFEITYDILPDSYVLLIFSERSIAQWLDSGGIIDPESYDRFSLSDAIALPGLLPDPSAAETKEIQSSQIQMRNKDGSTTITVTSDSVKLDNSSGTVELKSSGQVDINSGNLTIEP